MIVYLAGRDDEIRDPKGWRIAVGRLDDSM
jgi:hypothetical protein